MASETSDLAWTGNVHSGKALACEVGWCKSASSHTFIWGLQDSRDRIGVDTERAQREGWKFGAKLVRGAYMFMENERAKQKGFPSPVWPSKQDTHDNYDRCILCFHVAMSHCSMLCCRSLLIMKLHLCWEAFAASQCAT